MTNKNMPSETIERYLRQELSAKELSDFTFQMVMNPSLRKEVEANRTVFKTLQTTPAAAGTSTANSNNNKRIILAIAGALLLAIAAFVYFQKAAPTGNTIPPAELILPEHPPANVPIAQAFTPNQFIEDAMLTRDLPQGKFNLLVDGKMLRFSGISLTKNKEAIVTIYNNQQADFVEERFVFAKKIATDSRGIIDIAIENPLTPGLYYFDYAIDGSSVYLGKFEINN